MSKPSPICEKKIAVFQIRQSAALLRKKNAYRYANLERKRSLIFKVKNIFLANIHALRAKVCQKYTSVKRRWHAIDMLRMADAFLFP